MYITEQQKQIIRNLSTKYQWTAHGSDPVAIMEAMDNPLNHDITAELNHILEWHVRIWREGRGPRQGWTADTWPHKMQAWFNRPKRGYQQKKPTPARPPAIPTPRPEITPIFDTIYEAELYRLNRDRGAPLTDPDSAMILDAIRDGFSDISISRKNYYISYRYCDHDRMRDLLHRRIEAALPVPSSFLEYLASMDESWLLMLFLEATHEGSILGEDLPLKARQFDPCQCYNNP